MNAIPSVGSTPRVGSIFNRTLVTAIDPRPAPSIEGGEQPAAPSFSEVLGGLVSDTSKMQNEAGALIDAFVRGEAVDLHQVVAAVEEASLSLEILVELRNRLIEAHRTLINAQ